MDSDLDFQIVYAIKEGVHNFNKIADKVGGSKTKFSKHLAQLVKYGIIKKITKNGKPEYYLGNTRPFDLAEDVCNRTNLDISIITKTAMNFSNKRLLQIYVKETIMDLIYCSMYTFLADVLPLNQTQDSLISKSYLALTNLIKTRANILQKRDSSGKLSKIFVDLVKNQMIKESKQLSLKVIPK